MKNNNNHAEEKNGPRQWWFGLTAEEATEAVRVAAKASLALARIR